MIEHIYCCGCLSVYVIEVIIKIIGLGVFKYFDSGWNRLALLRYIHVDNLTCIHVDN